MGFRPFIFRLASMYRLNGEVDNRTNGVRILVDCDIKTIGEFRRDIIDLAPPASVIKSVELNNLPLHGFSGFRISGSKVIDDQITEVSPDIAVCDECLAEMSANPARINYPLINCTNCGPRFTIIRDLPYDRPATTMADFEMCDKCRGEYNDISDRRFHAQPVACNECGPSYILKSGNRTTGNIMQILEEIASLIESGRTVAVKGTGGYHLMCDALQNDAVERLRRNKKRDSKPFAVMFPGISEIKKFCLVSREEENELLSWRRPVVLLSAKRTLAESVSSGLNTVGAMLPSMPFHYLMFRYLKTRAVVMTSGNLSEEPVITDDDEAAGKLGKVTDSLVSYNRKIFNRADDSVVRIADGKPLIIRRSRGYVPHPVELDFNTEGILALGAEQKNSFCIGKNNQAIMSQYIGDLKNAEATDFFRESVTRFSGLFRFTPRCIACDLHPGYFTTHYASSLEKEYGIPLFRIQHHHAHIASCMAENGLEEKVIGISFDGTGYGTDGNIWGSEFVIASLQGFERYTHFDYVAMPGGDRASEEPWRMAYSYLYKYFGDDIDYEATEPFRSIEKKKLLMIRDMIKNDINCPVTSGAGRLFDAVAALTGLCRKASFDSEAPMRLESVINCKTDLYYPFSTGKTIVFGETLKALLDDLRHPDIPLISAKFHNTISEIINEVADKIRNEYSIDKVVLSGGVFQNKYLLEKSVYKLREKGFKVYVHRLVPSNDGGISLGQLAVASKLSGICA